jgi:5-methylcytosine-specific restriction protein B
VSNTVPMPPVVAGKMVMALTGPTPASLSTPASEAVRLLAGRRNVVLYGAPGTGKTFSALQVKDDWESKNGPGSVHVITFHPSYAYEDFVQGWRPDPAGTGNFKLTNGVLLEAVENAVAHAKLSPAKRVLLFIDEINRADVARTFGELITFIEWDKRGLPFSTSQDRATTRSIPDNLYFLGTMNTADKSVSLLDVAMRRRFAFVNVPPEPAAFTANGWLDQAHGVQLEAVMRTLNERLAQNSVELDRQIGQALLKVDPAGSVDEDLLDRLRYDVLPLVEDYLYGDAGRIAQVMPGFVDARTGRHHPVTTADLPSLLQGFAPPATSGGTSVPPALAPPGP